MSLHESAQLFGFCGLLFSLSIFQINQRNAMLCRGMVASGFYAIQYCVLGAYTGMAMNVLGGLRSYVFSKVEATHEKLWIIGLFTLFTLAAGLLTWAGPISCVAMGASLLGGIASWQQKTENVRGLMLIVSGLWLIYNISVGSYSGIVLEISMLTSNIIGQYRYKTGLIASLKLLTMSNFQKKQSGSKLG